MAGRVGLTLLLDGEFDRAAASSHPAGVDVTVADYALRQSDPLTILVQATSPLGLFWITDCIGR